MSLEEARNFCGAIKEFAAVLGKSDFFLAGEVAGGDYAQDDDDDRQLYQRKSDVSPYPVYQLFSPLFDVFGHTSPVAAL